MATFEQYLTSASWCLTEAIKAMKEAYIKYDSEEEQKWLFERAQKLDDQIASITRNIEDEESIAMSIEEDVS